MTKIAADVMTSPAIVVAPDATAASIAALLSERHISAVPVCRADGSLAGIVSEGDLLQPFRESTHTRRDWWLGLIAEGEDLSAQFLDYVKGDTRTAETLMVRDVVTADEQTAVPRLADLMVRHKIKRVPILRDGRVVGIVSRADLVAAIARTPELLTS